MKKQQIMKVRYLVFFFLVLIIAGRLLYVTKQINKYCGERTQHLILVIENYYSNNLEYPSDIQNFTKFLDWGYDDEYLNLFNDYRLDCKIDTAQDVFKLIDNKKSILGLGRDKLIHKDDYNLLKGVFYFGNVILFEDQLHSEILSDLKDVAFVKDDTILYYDISNGIYTSLYQSRKLHYENLFEGEYDTMFFLSKKRFKVILELNKAFLYPIIAYTPKDVVGYEDIFLEAYDSFKPFLDSNNVNRILIPIILFDTIPPVREGF